MKKIFQARIKSVFKKLQLQGCESALIIGSAPLKYVSRDTSAEYRQDSDFFYLTGSEEKDLILFIGTKFAKPILLAKKTNPQHIIWEGSIPNPKLLANKLGADLRICEDFRKELLCLSNGHEKLFYQNIPNTIVYKFVSELFSLPSHQRGKMPHSFAHLDEIIAPLRMIKDKYEIANMLTALQITKHGLEIASSLFNAQHTEKEIALLLEDVFKANNGGLAFPSIVASGANAAVLHYHKLNSKIKNNQYLLIDCGASYNNYSADISRCFPIGEPPKLLNFLHEVVIQAKEAAIAKIKPGVKIKEVHMAAAEVLVEGLKLIKVLKGNTKQLLKKRAYAPYFMHGIGHSLGLDTHDVGAIRGASETKLEAGMVITIEPGLYFSKKIGQIPACGFREEDDILVTQKGAKILSDFI